MRAILFWGQTLVNFQKGHDPLFAPQKVGGGQPGNLAVHGAFKEDGAENAIAIKTGAGDEAGAHLVDKRKHLVFPGPGIFRDAIGLEGLGGAAPALIQRGEEAGLGANFALLLLLEGKGVHGLPSVSPYPQHNAVKGFCQMIPVGEV